MRLHITREVFYLVYQWLNILLWFCLFQVSDDEERMSVGSRGSLRVSTCMPEQTDFLPTIHMDAPSKNNSNHRSIYFHQY